MQSRKQSLIESIVNIFIGFIISVIATFIIFPLVGIKSTPTQNLMSNIYVLHSYHLSDNILLDVIIITNF